LRNVPAASSKLSTNLVGTWKLTDRSTQRNEPGASVVPRPDSVIALLVYDLAGNFSAQFMTKDRNPSLLEIEPAPAGKNNSRTIAGYDAYFGTYVVDDETGTVTQTLTGCLAPENVGQVLTREMSVNRDTLTIQVRTTDDDGAPLVLSLNWRRLA
jgi:hypothetical protein